MTRQEALKRVCPLLSRKCILNICMMWEGDEKSGLCLLRGMDMVMQEDGNKRADEILESVKKGKSKK
jgi:hypothetical protein